jgi:DNA polymerase-3 subunit epsilon
MRWHFDKILYLDTETTGLDPEKNDIIQIGGLIEVNGKVVDNFEMYGRPRRPEFITPESVKVHKIKVETMMKFPRQEQMFDKFYKKINRYTSGFNRQDRILIVGYNVQFDIDFLRKFFNRGLEELGHDIKKINFGNFFYNGGVDPLPVLRYLAATGRMPMPKSFKQSTVAKMLGVKYRSHHARYDIEVTRQLMKYLDDGFQDTDFKRTLQESYGGQETIL